MVKANESWYVYALYSVCYNRVYVGMSQNPENRLKEHNAGRTASTKTYRPWVKVYQESVGEIAHARKREKQLKTGSGKEFIRSVISHLSF